MTLQRITFSDPNCKYILRLLVKFWLQLSFIEIIDDIV